MSSISKYAILGVGFVFVPLQAMENNHSVASIPPEVIQSDQNFVNQTPSEQSNSQQNELINVSDAGTSENFSNSENPPAVVENKNISEGAKPVANSEQQAGQEQNYNQEEVLGDMLSIGAYDSVMHSLKKQCEPQITSSAVKVEDFVGPIEVDVDSPCKKISAIPDWSRYSGDSAKTMNGWSRWWKYLRMKEPVIMGWVDNLVIRIYPKNEIYRSIFVNGIYDPNMIIVIDKFLSKDSVMIEAGANMGYVSLLLSKAIGANGKIYAIEPSKRDFMRLVDNVSLNKLSSKISCHNLAVLDKNGTEKLTVACEERSALNTLGYAFSFKGVAKLPETEEVTTITIDDFVRNERIERLDVIKLDVEGSELHALQGAKNSIAKFRPAIVLGVNKNALAVSEKLAEDTPKKEREQREKEKISRIYRDMQNILKELRYKAYKLVVEPEFSLQLVENLETARANIVYCLHESIIPPTFEQPKKVGFFTKLNDFFAK